MLKSLHIENIAVVERADVQFCPGLNVLTGETGAGKSIVIDALYAVTGGRASRELVRSGAEKGMASAVFDDAGTEEWLSENGIEPEDGELFVQRIITPEGKGSARVNGVPVPVSALRRLGTLLVDIHGQNDGRQLLDEANHLAYLDAFAGDGEALGIFETAYASYTENEREIARLTVDDDTARQLRESLSYRVQELEKAALVPGEEAELTERSELLRNGEKLMEAAEGAFAALYGSEESAVNSAGQARGFLSRARGWSPVLAQADDTLAEALSLLTDASELIRDFREEMDFSPEEFDRVESRLSQLRRLEKKFGVGDEAELIALYETSAKRLGELSFGAEALERLEKKRTELSAACRRAAKKLTEARTAAAKRLSQQVEAELKALSMPSVRFETNITPVENERGFDAKGADEVVFLMSANAGETPGRIAKIASGGELSRIMLALKTVFGQSDPVPTSVFDEIDTGVSGVAASRVGEKLAKIGRQRQVLCVSHLPQIAAMADSQYEIRKEERNGRTYTTVTELDRRGRQGELARLIGGDRATELTLASAEELLASADKIKESFPRITK